MEAELLDGLRCAIEKASRKESRLAFSALGSSLVEHKERLEKKQGDNVKGSQRRRGGAGSRVCQTKTALAPTTD